MSEPNTLLPNPPPQYSPMTTTSSGAIVYADRAVPRVRGYGPVLCVDTWM